MKKHYRPASSIALAGAFCAFLFGTSGANATASPAEASKAKDVTEVVTQVVEQSMQADHIPGVAVTIVKEGAIVLSKGFGFANLADRIPVDPEKTVFSIASVSKSFTALTALIEVRKNSLALDADVRSLAGFTLAQTFPQPVTPRQLLTHTSGFDDEEIGDSARTFGEIEPLGVYLKRRMPPQIAAPGTVVKYSNHGTALLGHVLEVASKKTFSDAVDESVFRPLGMTSSTFRQQPDRELDPRRASAYKLAGKTLVPVPRYFSRVSPAWGMSTTAQDMGRFLVAQLADDPALAQSTLGEAMQDMRATQFRQHPKMPGVTFGFFEAEMNGQKALFHEGGMDGFTSYLLLIPEERFGLFVVQNRRSGDLRRALTKAVIDHYFPPPAAMPIVAESNPSLKRFGGTYRFNRNYYRHNFMKVLPLLGVGDEVKVSPKPDTLHLDGRHAVPVGLNLFRWQDGPGWVGFAGSGEKPSTLLFGGIPLGAYVRIPWYETTLFHRTILLLAFCIFSGSLLLAGVRRIRKTSPANGLMDRKLSHLSHLTSGCFVLFMIGIATAFLTSGDQLQFGVPTTIRLALVLGVIAAALTVILVAGTVWNLRRGPWTVTPLLRFLLVPVAGVVTVGSMAYWKILGFWF